MKRLSKNFFSIIGSDITRRILGFLAIAYLARKIGVEGFGVLNIGFTVLTYALMISSFGLSSFGARAVARGESSGLVNTVVTIRLISSFCAFIIVSFIAIAFIANDTMTMLMVIFCLSLFPNVFLLDWYFQGKERMGIIGISRLLSAALYLGLIVMFVHSASNLIWVAVAAVLGDISAAIVIWKYYRRMEGNPPLKLSLFGWRSLIKQSLPLGGGSILGAISINLPPIVIGIMLNNRDVGIYSAATKLIFFLLMIDRVLATLLLPASSRLNTQSPELLVSRLRFAIKWIFIATLPICIGGTILADKIIPLIFGQQYTEAVDVFRILIWYFFITMFHTIYTSGLIAIGREKAYAAVMLLSVMVYGISIIICTKLFGVVGSAAAIVVSETVTLIYMRDRFQRVIKIPLPKPIVSIIVSSIFMGTSVSILPEMNLFISIGLGAIIYALLLFMTKSVTIGEINNLLGHL
jgi:O-antigen/teichoic acid export membrane protein